MEDRERQQQQRKRKQRQLARRVCEQILADPLVLFLRCESNVNAGLGDTLLSDRFLAGLDRKRSRRLRCLRDRYRNELAAIGPDAPFMARTKVLCALLDRAVANEFGGDDRLFLLALREHDPDNERAIAVVEGMLSIEPKLDQRCGGCGRCLAIHKCARCRQVYYCGTECQARHWKGGHAAVCKEPTTVKRMRSCS